MKFLTYSGFKYYHKVEFPSEAKQGYKKVQFHA